MELFEKIENILDRINIEISINELKASLKELDRLLNKAYKIYEVEKFTVFLSTIIKHDIEIKENEYLNMLISSRRVSVLKPTEKGKYLKKFRIRTIKKYSPFLINSQLFEYDFDETISLNKAFDDVVYYISNLETPYSKDDILKRLTNFKTIVKKINSIKNIDLTNKTIYLYSQLLTKNEYLKKDIDFYETQQQNIKLEILTIEQEFIIKLREELVNLDHSIINAKYKINLYKSLIKPLKKLNPYLIDQYDRRYLFDLINENFIVEFKLLNPITDSVVFKEFTEYTKDYRFTKIQHEYLCNIEFNLHKKGFIDIFDNKIIWRNSKAELNRICNYLSNNVDEFKGKKYNHLIRTIYKRYNLVEPNRNDLREAVYNSQQFIDDIKNILY